MISKIRKKIKQVFFCQRKALRQRSAQATLEFSFAMIVAVLLLMGMVQVIVWVGKDLVERRQAHEETLKATAPLPGGQSVQWGIKQTEPTFYYTTPIEATVASNIFRDEDF